MGKIRGGRANGAPAMPYPRREPVGHDDGSDRDGGPEENSGPEQNGGSEQNGGPVRDARDEPSGHGGGLAGALTLTVVSALVWGFAHLWVGRRKAGLFLLALYWLVVAGMVGVATVFRQHILQWSVRPDLLTAVTVGSVLLGFVWVAVVIRSYQIARPHGAPKVRRAAANATVGALCVLLCVPFAWAARYTTIYRDTLTSIFEPGSGGAEKVNTDDPWAGRPRVNVLLLGGDAAGDRIGVRTDSMTLASVDTRTGDTVLLSLPRNLEHFPMPAGLARQRFPHGFMGDGPANPGLLNEVYEYADRHPEVVPGVPKKRRGPTLVTETVSEILGQPIDYYILVDMFGFADIIDAMGGVKIKITQPIPFGRDGGVLQPGYRTLQGKDALWYGRSRNDSDDYTRMGRQKCLLRAIAQQANPQRVLTRFQKLAAATKRAISTNIPQDLLPALVELSSKVKHGADIKSLQFVPPLINPARPDFAEIRRMAAQAIADSEAGFSASTPSATPGAAAASGAGTTSPPPATRSLSRHAKKAAHSASPSPTAQSLAATCPS
jgi:LCP family protein required for cell wall assembly